MPKQTANLIRALTSLAFTALLALPATAGKHKAPPPPPVGEDVEVTSGVVTALSCAKEAREKKDLSLLISCPLSEIKTGLVVYDVAEEQIYRISDKAVYLYELEGAFGGGSIDFEGVVAKVKGGIAVIDVEDYEVTPKPKAGSFKGCL